MRVCVHGCVFVSVHVCAHTCACAHDCASHPGRRYRISVCERQGCTLSSLLFSIYTEELVARIRALGLGLKVGRGVRNMLRCLLYAHDIVINAEIKLCCRTC